MFIESLVIFIFIKTNIEKKKQYTLLKKKKYIELNLMCRAS